MARGLPAALADQLPFITAEVSLAKPNTPRHADKMREMAVAGCHERTGERSGVTVLLACFCHLFLLLSCGQIVPLRLGADPTLAPLSRGGLLRTQLPRKPTRTRVLLAVLLLNWSTEFAAPCHLKLHSHYPHPAYIGLAPCWDRASSYLPAAYHVDSAQSALPE